MLKWRKNNNIAPQSTHKDRVPLLINCETSHYFVILLKNFITKPIDSIRWIDTLIPSMYVQFTTFFGICISIAIVRSNDVCAQHFYEIESKLIMDYTDSNHVSHVVESINIFSYIKIEGVSHSGWGSSSVTCGKQLANDDKNKKIPEK